MAMNLTDSGSNMHSEEQQNPEQVAKFNKPSGCMHQR